MKSFNKKEIVSIKYFKECLNEDFILEEYRTFKEWITGTPKRLMYRGILNVCIDYMELSSLPDQNFIRDMKIWNKAKVVVRFSNNESLVKVFKNDSLAIEYKASLENSDFISE